MGALKTFEIEAIRLMANGQLSDEQIEALESYGGAIEYEYTGCGYFLRVRADWLPDTKRTLSDPAVVGKADAIVSGFVLFLRPHELELECHTWGAIDVPSDFRSRQVVVSTPPIPMMGPKDGANDQPGEKGARVDLLTDKSTPGSGSTERGKGARVDLLTDKSTPGSGSTEM